MPAKETHAPYALLWGAVVLVYGKTTKTACGKRIASNLLVPRGQQSCVACQAAIDAERAEYAEIERAAREQITKRTMELHAWRTAQFAQELYERMQRDSIPFCWECGDWHSPGEEHSATDH